MYCLGIHLYLIRANFEILKGKEKDKWRVKTDRKKTAAFGVSRQRDVNEFHKAFRRQGARGTHYNALNTGSKHQIHVEGNRK